MLLWDAVGRGQQETAQVEVPEEAHQACVNCHTQRKIGLGALRDWLRSSHAQSGVGCNLCHLPVPNAPEEIRSASTTCEDKRVRRLVSPQNCRLCHAQQVRQFAAGKHALAWVAMMAMPDTARQPETIIGGEKGCGGCHRIGRHEGKCDSCHTRHLFAAAEARRPEACRTCHMGFDHPQWEMYITSKHGSIYATEGQNWNWSLPLGRWFARPTVASPATPRTPTCAFCHLPNGDHAVKTAWGFLAVRLAEKDEEWAQLRNTIFRGLGVIDAQGQPTERFQVVQQGQVARLTAEEWQAQRDRMLKQCAQCHSPSFARVHLDRADAIIKESDRLMAEAVETVEGLYRDGLLPRPQDRPPHPDLLRFYNVENPIEQKLYVMFLEHRMRTFQGAFHLNPDYMHWYGWAEMKRDLVEIKHEAEQLRRAKTAP
ncbi:MAG TPA: cytochrome C [Armatimonadetes bacterium]|nr:cytochrome C [Armatimonadota bacterium]